MSCEACRENHTRCDYEQPRCRRCAKARRPCIRSSERTFASAKPKSFHPRQPWVPIPPRVDFVEEAESLQPPQVRAIVHNESLKSRAPLAQSGLPAVAQAYQTPSNQSSSEPAAIDAVDQHVIQLDDEQHQETSPLATKEGAELMRYFVERCACFFDFSDINRHFAHEVPQRARRNRMLANAMLALAARHRSRVQDYDAYISDHYYQKCLQALIPRLSNSSATQNDELLAAVVILRLLEEMDVSIVGSDAQGHLLGTQAIITASQIQTPSPVTPLRKACYWAAFRQEIFMSLSIQRPFKLRLASTALSDAGANDWDWSLAATRICGEVQAFVFGEDAANVQEYERWMQQIDHWKRGRPTAFDPVYQTSSTDFGSFPEVYYHLDCHVMGWLYISMASLLMAAHRPLPRIGPRHRQALQEMQTSATQEVRLICGVAKSNFQLAPAQLVACMAISLFGDRFENPTEQAVLRDILMQTERQTGWPTLAVNERLQQIWKWPASSNLPE